MRSVVVLNPKVREKARRRNYTADYKRLILKEAADCKKQGQIETPSRAKISRHHQNSTLEQQ